MGLQTNSLVNMTLALSLVVGAGLGCGFRKPWRDYSKKPFNAQQWRDGDAVTRGAMSTDLWRHPDLMGQRQDGVERLLGPPDKKIKTEGRDVWLYHIDIVGEWTYPYFPVSFDERGAAFAGRVKGGTISMIVDSDEL